MKVTYHVKEDFSFIEGTEALGAVYIQGTWLDWLAEVKECSS